MSVGSGDAPMIGGLRIVGFGGAPSRIVPLCRTGRAAPPRRWCKFVVAAHVAVELGDGEVAVAVAQFSLDVLATRVDWMDADPGSMREASAPLSLVGRDRWKCGVSACAGRKMPGDLAGHPRAGIRGPRRPWPAIFGSSAIHVGSWTLIRPQERWMSAISGSAVRGNHPGAALPAGDRCRWRAGSSSADGTGMGRGRRSSPSTGKPCTWRRAAASPQLRDGNARRSPVNTGASWPTPSEAEARVLEIQTKLH